MNVTTFNQTDTVGNQPYAVLRLTNWEAVALRAEVKRLALRNPDTISDPSDKRTCLVNQAWMNLGGTRAILESNISFRDMIRPIRRNGKEVGSRANPDVRWLDSFQRLTDDGHSYGHALSNARSRY